MRDLITTEGPWTNEPDRLEFRHAGYPCIVLRGPVGALCGYVGVPPGHPWHGKGYDDVDAEVHGGLTYAEHCNAHVCHVPEPGEADHFYWLGFDAAHLYDLSPGLLTVLNPEKFGMVYRDLGYMRAECESLAEQARQAVRP